MSEKLSFGVQEITDLLNSKYTKPRDPEAFAEMLGAFGLNRDSVKNKWETGPMQQPLDVMTARAYIYQMLGGHQLYKDADARSSDVLSTDQVAKMLKGKNMLSGNNAAVIDVDRDAIQKERSSTSRLMAIVLLDHGGDPMGLAGAVLNNPAGKQRPAAARATADTFKM